MSDAELSVADRLDRLEQQVQRISEHLGLTEDTEDPSAIPPEVVELARAGRQMEAIRLYTKRTGVDIGTATSIVNGIV